jgi:8-oxo-dGTP pyrophosphatase MutT (NUDIX family)
MYKSNMSPFKFVCGSGHRFCNNQIKKRKMEGCKGIGGIAVVIFDENNNLLVGKQRGGSHKNNYSVIHGKIDNNDMFCYKTAAIRETLEEFKIDVSNESFSKHFISNDNKIRCVTLPGTVIFIGIFNRNEINLENINDQIQQCVNDDLTPWALREVEDIRWIDIQDSQIPISKFTKIILNKIK